MRYPKSEYFKAFSEIQGHIDAENQIVEELHNTTTLLIRLEKKQCIDTGVCKKLYKLRTQCEATAKHISDKATELKRVWILEYCTQQGFQIDPLALQYFMIETSLREMMQIVDTIHKTVLVISIEHVLQPNALNVNLEEITHKYENKIQDLKDELDRYSSKSLKQDALNQRKVIEGVLK